MFPHSQKVKEHHIGEDSIKKYKETEKKMKKLNILKVNTRENVGWNLIVCKVRENPG